MEIDENELYERIFQLRDIRYNLEDRIEKIIEKLLHSHITLEEMDEVADLIES